MFGEGIFGDVVFADVSSLSTVRRRGRGVGGSGFPDGWEGLIAQQGAEDERRRREREQEEIAVLLAADLL